MNELNLTDERAGEIAATIGEKISELMDATEVGEMSEMDILDYFPELVSVPEVAEIIKGVALKAGFVEDESTFRVTLDFKLNLNNEEEMEA